MKNEKAAGCCSEKTGLKNKKGLVYTITTFLVFLGILAYVSASAGYQNSFQDTDSASMSSQRVFHYWQSVDSGVGKIMNISSAKSGNVFEINDTLPAEKKISELLDKYGGFVSQYFSDKTIDIHFEDGSGNKIELDSLSPQITLLPMNVTYGWDSWGKNEMQIESPASSFGYLYSINVTVNIVNDSIASNSTSITWNANKNCKSGSPCLLLYLYVSDGTRTIASEKTDFDMGSNYQSNNIACASGNCWLDFKSGGQDPATHLPVVLNIDLHNLNITTDTKITMNTSSFYANFPAKLFVGTSFASKLDYLG